MGVPGWVYRVGTGGAIPGYYPAAKLRPMTAKRAPEAPARGWSGWSWGVRTQGDGGGSRTTLRARSVHPWWPSLSWTLIAALQP